MLKIIVNRYSGTSVLDERNFSFSTLNKGREEEMEEYFKIDKMEFDISDERFQYLILEVIGESGLKRFDLYFKMSDSTWQDNDKRAGFRQICIEKIREYRLSKLLDN